VLWWLDSGLEVPTASPPKMVLNSKSVWKPLNLLLKDYSLMAMKYFFSECITLPLQF